MTEPAPLIRLHGASFGWIEVVQQDLEQLLDNIGGRSIRQIEVCSPGQRRHGQLQRQWVATPELPGPTGGLCG